MHAGVICTTMLEEDVYTPDLLVVALIIVSVIAIQHLWNDDVLSRSDLPCVVNESCNINYNIRNIVPRDVVGASAENDHIIIFGCRILDMGLNLMCPATRKSLAFGVQTASYLVDFLITDHG